MCGNNGLNFLPKKLEDFIRFILYILDKPSLPYCIKKIVIYVCLSISSFVCVSPSSDHNSRTPAMICITLFLGNLVEPQEWVKINLCK